MAKQLVFRFVFVLLKSVAMYDTDRIYENYQVVQRPLSSISEFCFDI